MKMGQRYFLLYVKVGITKKLYFVVTEKNSAFQLIFHSVSYIIIEKG